MALLFLAIGASAVDASGATNLVVDFESTTVTSNLNPGESGTLNLVVENSGGFDAEEVNVWVHSDSKIKVDKRFYVGLVDAGERKVVTTTFSVSRESDVGLTGISITITFDGYNSEGQSKTNQVTTWELPVTIYGEPLFQITPSKTTYSKDTVEKLYLSGSTESSVKALEAVFSSSCIMVVGSSKQYVGDVSAGGEFMIAYDIKPKAEGSCSSSVGLYYTDAAGSRVSENITLGLVVGDTGVDFKIMSVDYDQTGPGETAVVGVELRNVGSKTADATTVSLGLDDPFSPTDTAEKYVGKVLPNQTATVEFNVFVSWDADTTTYTIPLTIEYKVGGTTSNVSKTIGLDVSGKVVLEVINVESSGSTLKIDVANIGTKNAESVKATLITTNGVLRTSSSSSSSSGGPPGGGVMIPGLGDSQRQTTSSETGAQSAASQTNRTRSNQTQYVVSYKSDIKSTKQTTFTFDVSVSGSATLVLEYNGPNNQRVSQREAITIPGSSSSSLTSFSRRSGTDYTMYAAGAVILLVVGFFVYRRYRKKK
jgi:hypothetical protein